MCRTPPYHRQRSRSRLAGGLHALGIARLDRDTDLPGLRPENPLSELTAALLEQLPTLIDHWITNVRAHAAEPEPATGEQPFAHTKPPFCAAGVTSAITSSDAQMRSLCGPGFSRQWHPFGQGAGGGEVSVRPQCPRCRG